MLAFTVTEVSAKYIAQVEKDRRITRIGKYAGMLSAVTLAAADDMAASGSNLLQLKSPATAIPTATKIPSSGPGSSSAGSGS